MSETDDYLDAVEAFDISDSELTKLSALLESMAVRLSLKSRMATANTLHGRGLPATLGAWPSAVEIRGAVQRWNDAKTKMQEAWEKVPTYRRGGMKSPTDRLRP